ncbi:hypothetical protein Tco_0546221 [Tanacetum coccineum]
MISKKDSGSKIDLEEIKEFADEEPIVNTNTQQEVVTHVKPDDISLPIHKISGRTAFLNGKLREDVFMVQPEGFENAKYPNRLLVAIISASMRKSHSLDFLKAKMSPVYKSKLIGKYFTMKDLGDAAYILGIKIYKDRSKRLIGLSQDTYLDKILKRFKMDNSKKGNLPLHHGIKISKDLCLKTDEELDRISRVPYASVAGSIMYAMTCTRLDVSFALSMSAVTLTKEPKDHGKSKHIKRKYHFVRSKVEEGHMIVRHIRSEDNPADPFTKVLAKSRHDEHARST